MAVFDNFPYTNTHEMNLDWIIKRTENVLKSADEIAANTQIAQESAENASQSELNAKASKEASADYAATLGSRILQIDQNTDDIAIQTARIDTIIEGSTSDPDAELLDIRVGYQGTIYDTAGNAVRGQVTEVHNEYLQLTSDNAIKPPMIQKSIDDIEDLPFTVTTGRYWYKSSSTPDGFDSSSDANFNMTNKINITDMTGVLHIPFTANLYTSNRYIMVMYYGSGTTYYREQDARNPSYPEVSLNASETEVLINLDMFRESGKALQLIGFNFATGTTFYVKRYFSYAKAKLNWLLVDSDNIVDNEIPVYWKSTLDTIASTVKSECVANNEIPVVFISDCHYISAANVHGKLLKYLDDKINFAAILNGGDFASQSTGTIASHTEEMENAMNVFDPVINKHLPTVGNHESVNVNNMVLYPLEMTNYIIHNHLSQISGVHAGYEDNAYYYKDDGSRKIRYILLNAHQQYKTHYRVNNELVEYTISYGYSKLQLQWLADKALKFDEPGWSVIIVSHIYNNDPDHVNGSENETQTNNFNTLFNIIEAAKNKTSGNATTGQGVGESVSWDFSDNNDFEIIGYYCGHYHCDSDPFTNGNTTVIPTMSANLNVHPVPGVNVTKTLGTTTETAFDILCINKTTKHVNLYRVGAGSDRSYNY